MASQGLVREAGPQLWVGDEEPTPEKVEPITNRRGAVDKPEGGFWTCPKGADETSGWVEWMAKERFIPYEDPGLWELTPSKDVELYRITEPADAGVFIPGGPAGYGPFDDPPLDFETVFELCDGVHMTAEGLVAMKSPLANPNLHGWDCETIVWSDWKFDGEPEFLGELDLSRRD